MRFHDPLDDAAGVVGIEDVEARPQTCHLWLDAQLPRAEAVERARSNAAPRPSPRADADAAGHLGCRLVGEGDGQDAVGRNAC